MSNTSGNRGNSIGAGLGTAVRGAFQTVQGVGDNLRGNIMDFVDSATGTDTSHPETDLGRKETEQGIHRMEAGRHANDTQMHSSTTTSTQPPALPPRSLDTKEGPNTANHGVGGELHSDI